MSRGLGKVERKIIELLEECSEETGIRELIPMVYYDKNYWRKIDSNDKEFYDEDIPYPPDLTKSQIQAVYRAIRSLNRKGHISLVKKYPGYIEAHGHGGYTYYKEVKLNV